MKLHPPGITDRANLRSVRQSSSGFHPTRPLGRAVAFRSQLPSVGPAEDLPLLTSYRSIMPSEPTTDAAHRFAVHVNQKKRLKAALMKVPNDVGLCRSVWTGELVATFLKKRFHFLQKTLVVVG